MDQTLNSQTFDLMTTICLKNPDGGQSNKLELDLKRYENQDQL